MDGDGQTWYNKQAAAKIPVLVRRGRPGSLFGKNLAENWEILRKIG